jgi:hypothetical protein
MSSGSPAAGHPRSAHPEGRLARAAPRLRPRIEQGARYPALFRLVRQGLLKTSWATSEHNRRAKFDELTAAGRKRLREETTDSAAGIALVETLIRSARVNGVRQFSMWSACVIRVQSGCFWRFWRPSADRISCKMLKAREVFKCESHPLRHSPVSLPRPSRSNGLL